MLAAITAVAVHAMMAAVDTVAVKRRNLVISISSLGPPPGVTIQRVDLYLALEIPKTANNTDHA
jgi:hypothetical protein